MLMKMTPGIIVYVQEVYTVLRTYVFTSYVGSSIRAPVLESSVNLGVQLFSSNTGSLIGAPIYKPYVYTTWTYNPISWIVLVFVLNKLGRLIVRKMYFLEL